MTNQKALVKFVLQLADNNLILGHRLSEWCGHGPQLEQDIALSNISLDLLGQARMYFQYAAELIGEEETEDSLAFLRKEKEYLNVLLVEQDNIDFAVTIARQFIYDSHHLHFLKQLENSPDSRLKAIAQKAIKEVTYHRRYSSEWVLRLGDGTEESHNKMQAAINVMWKFSGELNTCCDYEEEMIESGVISKAAYGNSAVRDFINGILDEATLSHPDLPYFRLGGKTGKHSEQMGFILAELQYIQRAYPGMQW